MSKTTDIKKDIQTWWADNPMTYASTHGQTSFTDGDFSLGSREFFERLDHEFYSWNAPLHTQRPFDRLFPYDLYKGKKVLEIGCGLGTMLMNWAQNGSMCSGVDLNPTSIEQTKKRFELYNLNAHVTLEDANNLTVQSDELDYVYSWGVLHHSPNLALSIKELFRILKPGGGFGIMLYNRHSLQQWYLTDFVEGFLHNENQWLNRLELTSRYGDGHREEGNPHTWPITKKEGLGLIRPYSKDCQVKILGTDIDCSLRLLFPAFGKHLPLAWKKAIARRLGWSLWFFGHKDL